MLFVIAQPPEAGQTIFPCHKEFQGGDRKDNLSDGAIYVRGTSNSRPARAGEVLALVERARRGKSPIFLSVNVVGEIHRVDRVDEVLQTLRDLEEEQFRKEPVLAVDAFARTSITMAISLFGGTAHLTQADRDDALAKWRTQTNTHLRAAREHMLGLARPGAGISVMSHHRFVAKLISSSRSTAASSSTTSAWMERTTRRLLFPFLRPGNSLTADMDFSAVRPSIRNYPVAWNNSGDDARVILTRSRFARTCHGPRIVTTTCSSRGISRRRPSKSAGLSPRTGAIRPPRAASRCQLRLKSMPQISTPPRFCRNADSAPSRCPFGAVYSARDRLRKGVQRRKTLPFNSKGGTLNKGSSET